MLIAIALVAANGVIGDGKDQPFKFAEDWARFKQVTMGHPLIMGRKTFEALGSRLLPGRATIVITRTENYQLPEPKTEGTSGYVVGSLEAAIELANQLDETVFIAGGGEIYAQAMPLVDRLDLTEVHQETEGQVKFPEIDDSWVEVSRTPMGQFDFVTYERQS